MLKENLTKKDCTKCLSQYCPAACFNVHGGSMIALRKLCEEMNDKKHDEFDKIQVHIIGRPAHERRINFFYTINSLFQYRASLNRIANALQEINSTLKRGLK